MKHIKFLIIIGFVVLGAYYGWFAYINLRGARPAFGPPADKRVTEMEKPAQNATDFPLTLPPGFSISIYAKDLGGPRVLAMDPAGTLFVSTPSRGQVVALPDVNKDGIADRTDVVVDHLNGPHGLAFHPKEKTLYIAETNSVSVYNYDQITRKATNRAKIIDLPGGGNHVTRTIVFGPDGRLYISVGSSCNVCVEADTRRAAILVTDVTGLNPVTSKVFAAGLRNSVFFRWHPKTGELWATDMGRDLIGDDIPLDEVNIIRENGFYGWPYCYGKNIRDTAFEPKGLNLFGFQGLTLTEDCQRATPSHIDIPAHSAPLGLVFVPSAWPSQYRDDLLVAYHGSWNRSEPTGYKVVRMKLDAEGKYEGRDDFITGWLAGDSALGRPVDLLFDNQGVLFISDDKAGVIYRVAYQSSQ